MCYHHRHVLRFPKSDVRFQTASNSQDQRARPLFFRAQCGWVSRISAEQTRSMADILMEKQQNSEGEAADGPFDTYDFDRRLRRSWKKAPRPGLELGALDYTSRLATLRAFDW